MFATGRTVLRYILEYCVWGEDERICPCGSRAPRTRPTSRSSAGATVCAAHARDYPLDRVGHLAQPSAGVFAGDK